MIAALVVAAALTTTTPPPVDPTTTLPLCYGAPAGQPCEPPAPRDLPTAGDIIRDCSTGVVIDGVCQPVAPVPPTYEPGQDPWRTLDGDVISPDPYRPAPELQTLPVTGADPVFLAWLAGLVVFVGFWMIQRSSRGRR